MLWSFYWQTTNPNKHQNTSGTCVVRKKRQSGMSKTKPQAKLINKFVVFWQTNMSWYLLRLMIRQQTFLKYLKCSWFCQSFKAEFIEDVYKKTTIACLQLLVNRDLKHQWRNGTTTLTRSQIQANLLGMCKVVKTSSSLRWWRNTGRFATVAKT